MLRLVALFVALTVMMGACGSDKEITVLDRNDELPVALDISLTGDLDVSFRDTVQSRFIVRRFKVKTEDERNSQVMGTEPIEPIKHGSGALVAGFALTPYEGDGTYTIPIGSPFDIVKQAQTGSRSGVRVTSSIKVEWWPNGNFDTDPEVYMRRAKPCRVVVKDHGTRGTLNCPDVTNEQQDKHFTLALTWEAPDTSPSTSTTAVGP